MNTKNINSHKGFTFGLISLIGFVGLVLITKYLNNSTNSLASVVIGFLTISIGIISIMGIIYSIKGIKDPNTSKKILGLLLNLGFVTFFLYVIIANVLDVLKLFTD